MIPEIVFYTCRTLKVDKRCGEDAYFVNQLQYFCKIRDGFQGKQGRFRELAESALERLPEEYRKYFMNITISVEDYPCREDAERLNLKRNRLLGLHSGVPHTDKEGFYHSLSPA